MKSVAICLLLTSLFLCANGQTPEIGSQGTTRAIVVGISDYQDPNIPDLKYADRDANAFANFLRSDAGGKLDEDQMKVLLNEKATMAQFAMALDWIWEVSKENDKAIIYFSGHGDVEKKSFTQPGFLLCWDAPSRVYMAGGAFSLSLLKDVISSLSIQNKTKVILITDACRAGKLAGNEIGGSQMTNLNLRQQFANEIKILSCQPDEFSLEGEQWGGGRGAFSYHLLDGLYGMADQDEDLYVNLMEIQTYVQQKVTAETAPHNQLPLIVGDIREKLFKVDDKILAELENGKRGQLQVFAAVDTRGIEENVLANVDSISRETYLALKKSISDKRFFLPENDCAEYYYDLIIKDPQFELLHSSLKRNYAAALQDDAQQVLNKLLSSDVSELSLSKIKKAQKYSAYPVYLERAADLLGKGHYIYNALIARKIYFETYLTHIDSRNLDRELGESALAKYRSALELEPESPHIYYQMIAVHNYQMQNQDSAEFYAHKATEMAPSWKGPYSRMAYFYLRKSNSSLLERAKHFLELADQISPDQSNIWHTRNWHIYNVRAENLSEAETLARSILDTNYSHTYSDLGSVLWRMTKTDKAEIAFLKAIEIDSLNVFAIKNLGFMYSQMNRLGDAEKQLKKAIMLNPLDIRSKAGLVLVLIVSERYEEAENEFQDLMDIDSTQLTTYVFVGHAYMDRKKYDKAEPLYEKVLAKDPQYIIVQTPMIGIYIRTNRLDKARELYGKMHNEDKYMRYHNDVGRYYAQEGYYKEAEAIFRKVLKTKVDEFRTLVSMGVLLTRQNKYKEASGFFDQAKALDASHKELLVAQALMASMKNEKERVYEFLEQAIDQGLNPGDSFIEILIDPAFEKLKADSDRWEEIRKRYEGE